MLVYLLLPIVAGLPGFMLCREKYGRIGRGIYCTYFALCLTIVEGMRYGIGYDYEAYRQTYVNFMFRDTVADLSGYHMEKGYLLPQFILSTAYPDPRVMFFVVAALISIAIAVWIYMYSPNPAVSAMAFAAWGPVFYTMNFLRQSFAALVVLYALVYIKKNDFLRYFALVLLATCFHWSALFMIPFFFILKIRITPLVLVIYSTIATLLLIFSYDITDAFIKFSETMADKGYSAFVPSRYSHYLYGSVEFVNGIFIEYVIGYGLLFLFGFLFHRYIYKRDIDNKYAVAFMFFTLLLDFWGRKHAIISRLDLYFVFAATIMFVPVALRGAYDWVDDKFKKHRRIGYVLTSCVMVGISVYFLGSMLLRGSNGCIPYTMWSLDTSALL